MFKRLSSRRNKLRAVRGKKQMIGGVRTRSGDAVTLQLSVVCAAAPGLPSLAGGQKLPADRLCRAINVSFAVVSVVVWLFTLIHHNDVNGVLLHMKRYGCAISMIIGKVCHIISYQAKDNF